MGTGTSAATRARRLLALMHLLRKDSRHSLETISAMLGTTPGEIAQDLDSLACCGVAPYTPDSLMPIYVDDGVLEVFGSLPALTRGVRLSSTEAQAIAAALQLAGMDSSDPLTTRLLEAAAPSRVDTGELERVLRATAAPGSGPALTAVAAGMHQRRVVTITYRSAARTEAIERQIEPASLVAERGAWYVEAYCRRAGALRTFRIDRIQSAHVTDESFEPRELTITGSALSTEELPRALVRFAPGEQFTEREWPGGVVKESAEDGSLLADIPYAGLAWLARRVAARAGAVEVVEPKELRDAVVEVARAELAALDAG